jgi:hypothetical protein
LNQDISPLLDRELWDLVSPNSQNLTGLLVHAGGQEVIVVDFEEGNVSPHFLDFFDVIALWLCSTFV